MRFTKKDALGGPLRVTSIWVNTILVLPQWLQQRFTIRMPMAVRLAHLNAIGDRICEHVNYRTASNRGGSYLKTINYQSWLLKSPLCNWIFHQKTTPIRDLSLFSADFHEIFPCLILTQLTIRNSC